jgi:hypothetical protein
LKPPQRAETNTQQTRTPETAVPGGGSRTADQECKELRRGFQVLGPEGWRVFRQDERLLLAMSSSGKPLISTMQELAGRVLNNQPSQAELLLPLVREELRATRAKHQLDVYDPKNPSQGLARLDAAIKDLSDEEAGK